MEIFHKVEKSYQNLVFIALNFKFLTADFSQLRDSAKDHNKTKTKEMISFNLNRILFQSFELFGLKMTIHLFKTNFSLL